MHKPHSSQTSTCAGHTRAHWGLPPHRSHLNAQSSSSLKCIAWKGQASTHALQPMQTAGSTTRAPASDIRIAPPGQAAAHNAFLHCRQMMGVHSRVDSLRAMWTRLSQGEKAPLCTTLQVASHCLHPTHCCDKSIFNFIAKTSSGNIIENEGESCKAFLPPGLSSWSLEARLTGQGSRFRRSFHR